MPSFEGIPTEIFQYVAPLGTYFDAYPIHLLTTASLRGLASHYPEGAFVPERFRPNIVIATDDNSTRSRASWKGKVLRLGTVEITLGVPTIRCVMTTLPQGISPRIHVFCELSSAITITMLVPMLRFTKVAKFMWATLSSCFRRGNPYFLLQMFFSLKSPATCL